MSNISKKPGLYIKASLLNKCPACEKGGIYSGLLDVKDECTECRFPLKEHDAGDGPAFFAMFLSGIIITVSAAVSDAFFQIALWVHMVIWTPVTILISIYFLRVTKSFLIAMEYKYNRLGFRKDKQ